LLFHFKPRNAKVTVDGKEYFFKKAWLAPTMNGRYYGGGMMAAPNQDRLNKDHKVSLMVMYGKGKLKTLIAFPGIFKGEHIKKNFVKVIEGNNIKVEFDKPCALQIDGETILDVTEYNVITSR
jgi:diacylglycerol kinase family enzyme